MKLEGGQKQATLYAIFSQVMPSVGNVFLDFICCINTPKYVDLPRILIPRALNWVLLVNWMVSGKNIEKDDAHNGENNDQ